MLGEFTREVSKLFRVAQAAKRADAPAAVRQALLLRAASTLDRAPPFPRAVAVSCTARWLHRPKPPPTS
jgi:hypothetical protein